MRLAVFSDLHLTNQNPKFKSDGDGVSDLLKEQAAFVEDFVKYADENDVDVILFLGDITDRATLDPITQTYLNRSLKSLSDSSVPDIILLEGNHCTADQLNKFSVLGAASEAGWDRDIRFVTGREVIDITVGDETVSFHVFPYTPDYRQIELDIAELNAELKDAGGSHILLFHFPCINAQLDNGVPSPKGVNLSWESTDSFLCCLGGDFHTPQFLHGNPLAYYVGAPFSLKFNEYVENRGFAIVDIDTENCDYEVTPVANDRDFVIQSFDAVEAAKLLDIMESGNGPSPEKVILRLVGEIDAEDLSSLKSKGLYKFSNPKSRVYETPAEMAEHLIEAEGMDDDLLLAEQLDDADDDLKQRCFELFGRIKSEGD